MKSFLLRTGSVAVFVLAIGVLDGIMSGQTALWMGLLIITALLGIAWIGSQQTKKKAPARAANTDKRQAVKVPTKTASIVTHQGGLYQ